MVGIVHAGLFFELEFEPLARLMLPLDAFRRAGVRFERGSDDLDDYAFAVLQTDGEIPFAILHYDRQPDDAVELFVPRDAIPPVSVPTFLAGIALEFGISQAYFDVRDNLDEPFLRRGSPDADDHGRPPVTPIPIIHWAREKESAPGMRTSRGR